MEGESLRDIYNYGDIKGVYELQQYSDKITSKKSKFGNASIYLDSGWISHVWVDHLLDTTKGFTFSFWYYDALLVSDTNLLCRLNLEEGSIREGMSYGGSTLLIEDCVYHQRKPIHMIVRLEM